MDCDELEKVCIGMNRDVDDLDEYDEDELLRRYIMRGVQGSTN